MTENQREAIEWAQHLLRLNPYFVDTETTGTDRNAEIVSIAIVDRNEEMLYSDYVRPAKPIDEEGEACKGDLHNGGTFAGNGITNAMVKDAPTFRELWERKEIRNALHYSSVCAYNAEFDGRMIQQAVRRFSTSHCFEYWKCAMKAYSQYAGERYPADHKRRPNELKWHKLSEACEAMGIEVDAAQTHGSLYDALLLVRLVKRMAEGEGE